MLGAGPVQAGDAAPDATLSVSSGAFGDTLGLSLVEGLLRFQGKKYRATLRGVASGAQSEGNVFGLVRPFDIEGSYRATDGGLRNERGVVLVFDPPLQLTNGEMQVILETLIYPKVSTGERSSVD